MTAATPEPGTTRYLCPLACGWHHDVPPPSLADLAGINSDPTASSLPEAIQSIATQAGIRQAQQTEAAVRAHLDTHTSDEDRRAIRRLFASAALASAAEG